MGKETKEGKDGQESDESPSRAAVMLASVDVADTEYLEQKGELSSLPLEPASPLLFSYCLSEAPKRDGNTRVGIIHLNFHKINVIV